MNGVQEAESSNLSTQTTKSPENTEFSGLLLFLESVKKWQKIEVYCLHYCLHIIRRFQLIVLRRGYAQQSAQEGANHGAGLGNLSSIRPAPNA
jgi:hypothetical protein